MRQQQCIYLPTPQKWLKMSPDLLNKHPLSSPSKLGTWSNVINYINIYIYIYMSLMPTIWQWLAVHLILVVTTRGWRLREAAINVKYGSINRCETDNLSFVWLILIHTWSELKGVIIVTCQLYFYTIKYHICCRTMHAHSSLSCKMVPVLFIYEPLCMGQPL